MDNIRTRSKILAIDDNKTNLKLLSRILEKAGYQYIYIEIDSRLAVQKYLSIKPDLILLDINMPHMNGFEVINALQNLNERLMAPIVVISAQSSMETTLQALNLGARDYVIKPFDETELLLRVRNLLDAHITNKILQDQNNILDMLVKERTKDLELTRRSVIERLGRAAEYKDEETGNHIIRMSKICELIAIKLGWSEKSVELILNASPMHDIGKLGIPDSILLKPGKLNSEEWEIMKTHTIVGAALLSGDESELMVMAKNIALSHHEKWDGSGYPNGLNGNNIPIEGRIAAIADVFDALTSPRPYKRAWTMEETINLIKNERGNHFDPELVDIFIDSIEEIIELKNTYSE